MENRVTGLFANLRTVYPDVEAWQAADPADMAGVLLKDLQSFTSSMSAHNLVSTFREQSSRLGIADYQQRLGPLLEAYAWLQNHGLIAPNPNQPEDFDVLTRRAKTLDESGFTGYRRMELGLYDVLDSRISQKVWGTYLRGDYDIAIAYAFKVVEVRMRERASLPTSDFSDRLVKKFFRKFEPPEGRSNDGLSATEYLFIGALKRYRNEAVHEPQTIEDAQEALEVLLLANHCLRIVDGAELSESDAGNTRNGK